MPFPYVANEAGWIVSEVGRQPWIIYGLMKTAEGTSATVSPGETIFTLIGFLGMYFMLGLLFIYWCCARSRPGRRSIPRRSRRPRRERRRLCGGGVHAHRLRDFGRVRFGRGGRVAAGRATERERSAVIATIGPFWNGNEVWLIAAGGALFALFPRAYASAFSGFYLPFIVVLWLLILRGIALELRDHFESPLWRGFWDVTFTASSALLIAIFGVALGNLIRGVPLTKRDIFRGRSRFFSIRTRCWSACSRWRRWRCTAGISSRCAAKAASSIARCARRRRCGGRWRVCGSR